MKTNLIYKSFFILCAVMFASLSVSRAQVTNSTWAGQTGDNWSDASKWNPAIVPNNNGTHTYNVTAGAGSEYPGIALDIDVTVSSLTLTDEGSAVTSTDRNFSSASTSLAANFPHEQFGGGFFQLDAFHRSVTADLGNLADFSGTTLNGGNLFVFTPFPIADAGITATIRFNGANVVTNKGDIQLFGIGSRFTDEHGNDGLRNFRRNTLNGVFCIGTGRDFTTSGSLLNKGFVEVDGAVGGGDASSVLTVDGDYTVIGNPLVDLNAVGATILTASGTLGNAHILVNGTLGNYNACTRTLDGGDYYFFTGRGRRATIQTLGGAPLDIVTSTGLISLIGPDTGFRDSAGRDALRDLNRIGFMRIADRNFTTAGAFIVDNRLSIYGGAHFSVNGALSIRAGFFELTSRNAFLLFDFTDAFPTDPPFMPLTATVKGHFDLQAGSALRVRFGDAATAPTLRVNASAKLSGDLQPDVLVPVTIDSSTRWTILTAKNIVGHFSNVASGQRIDLINGQGSMLVTITKTAVVLSDFQPPQ